MAFTNQPAYHWRELPQVSFWSRQKFCRYKHCFVATKDVFCRDKSMLSATKRLSNRCVCRDKTCRDKHTFAARKHVFCRDKHVFCRHKTFVATKMILVAAPANDPCQLRSSSDTSILCLPSVRTHSLGQRYFFCAAPSVWNSLPCKVR